MIGADPRGNPVGTASNAAREAAESALWRMMSFYDVPLAGLDAAIAADPGWAMPHAMKAGFLLSLTEPSLVDEALQHLAAAHERERSCTARERAHLEALQQLAEGRWSAACRAWDALLLEYPRDAAEGQRSSSPPMCSRSSRSCATRWALSPRESWGTRSSWPNCGAPAHSNSGSSGRWEATPWNPRS